MNVEFEQLLKPAEAAKVLRISPRSVQMLCQLGQLEHEVERSPGGRTRYFIPASAIRAYKERRRRDAERINPSRRRPVRALPA